jgi:hypothetical protein
VLVVAVIGFAISVLLNVVLIAGPDAVLDKFRWRGRQRRRHERVWDAYVLADAKLTAQQQSARRAMNVAAGQSWRNIVN